MPYKIPKLSEDFVLIVDWENPEIAAVVTSYLYKKDTYLPIFYCPVATIAREEKEPDFLDEHVITRINGHEFNIHVENALKRLKGTQNLILAGLSEDQKSYLTFLGKYNVIEISNVHEVEIYLSGFFIEKVNFFICRPDDIFEGLYLALKLNAKLKIDNNAVNVTNELEKKEGIIVIEKIRRASTVIAINYAMSMDAAIKLVEPLLENEDKEIKHLIEDWQNKSKDAYQKLEEKVNIRVHEVNFPEYNYSSFFTTGLPYSLILKDIIPCTYIHLFLRPDFFIFNNLFNELHSNSGSAIVFSPQFFKDEETEHVIEILNAKEFYVREIIGEDASVFNLDMNLRTFPFDIFHICSHGGEVDGYSITAEFNDRDGIKHTIEYDQIVGFAFNEGQEKIPVHIMRFWRKFDNLDWKSPELKAKNHPHYVFTDLFSAMDDNFQGNIKSKIFKPSVPGSFSIKCSDSIYQGFFNMTAGANFFPVIFNNTCW